MKHILVLVADQSHARLFGGDSLEGPLEEIEGFSNAAGKNREQDFVSDAPGRTDGPAGTYPHPMGRDHAARAHNLDVFASAICRELEQLLYNAATSRLYVIAGPRFLGVLRNKMTAAVKKHVVSELDKELTEISAEGVLEYARKMSHAEA